MNDYLVKKMFSNRTLKNLDISNNQINSIIDLKNLKDLEILDISYNNISDWFEIVMK